LRRTNPLRVYSVHYVTFGPLAVKNQNSLHLPKNTVLVML